MKKPSMRTAWAVLALLAVAIAGYAVRGMVSPSARPSFMADLFARAPLLMVFHVGGGSAALLIGAIQVTRRIRSRFLFLHRWLGTGYAVAVLLAGTTGLALAPSSFGGMVTHLGFGGLGVCWLATTILAVRSILRLDITAHRRWMYRSYSLTLAAVTLRIYLPLSLALGIGFEDAYRVVSWLCWVPNLVIVEVWLLPRVRLVPRLEEATPLRTEL
jgi:uncharacterized membrane protein